MLTPKERKVLRFLMSTFRSDYSINYIARECRLAPNGALKILRKFEREGVLKAKAIANIKSYKINLENEKTMPLIELALVSELEGRIKHRQSDFKELKEITDCCILFGSYIEQKNEPRDLDVLFVLDKKNYKEYKNRLADAEAITPAKIHDVAQTKEDLKKNLLNGDKVILNILQNGIVLWGQKIIAEVINDAYNK